MKGYTKAGEFAPLTPEILRRAGQVVHDGVGMCWAIRWAPGYYGLTTETLAAFRRLYEASEGRWRVDSDGYLRRFGLPDQSGAVKRRRACLLRMADWLEALEQKKEEEK